MNFSFILLLSYSVGIAAIIGLFRWKNMERAYVPFILFLWVGFINEIVTYFAIKLYRTNAVNCNIYVIVSSLLLIYCFKKWGSFERSRNSLIFIVILYVITWMADNLVIGSIHKFNPYFRILYCFVTVLLSINLVNRIIVEHSVRLVTHSLFIICISFILFFTYKALVEIFWLYGLSSGKSFRQSVYRIMTYINLAVNLLYAIAVLWIPRRHAFTRL